MLISSFDATEEEVYDFFDVLEDKIFTETESFLKQTFRNIN